MEENVSTKTWGMYLSTAGGYSRGHNQNYPVWVEKFNFLDRGPTQLFIWDNLSKKAAVLSAIESIALLKKLTAGNDWQVDGVSITRRALQFQIPVGRKKKKKGEIQSDETSQTSEKSTWVDEALVILPPETGYVLLELLQQNQKKLQSLADEENEMQKKALGKVYDLLFKLGREVEEKDVNFPSRNFAWARENDPHHWVCIIGENRGLIKPGKEWRYWLARVQFPGNRSRDKYDFLKLIDAVNWVESELQNPDLIQPVVSDIDQERNRQSRLAQLSEKVKQYPIQIKPDGLDSKKISYRIIIDVESKPIGKETYETEWGDVIEYGKKYLTPIKLALQIGIDPDLYQIDQPFGENSKWCRFTGLTTYLIENLAMNQAQTAWDLSKIISQYKAGIVTRGRYGYMETETKYPVFIGECSESSSNWAENQTRQEFLEKNALRQSIFHSLNVEDLRCYLDLDVETLSDIELLTLMHETRAESRFLSNEEKLKSQIWLSENKPKDKK